MKFDCSPGKKEFEDFRKLEDFGDSGDSDFYKIFTALENVEMFKVSKNLKILKCVFKEFGDLV